MQRQKIKRHELAEEDIVEIIRDCNNSAKGMKRLPSLKPRVGEVVSKYHTPTKKDILKERPTSAHSDGKLSPSKHWTNVSPSRLDLITKLTSPEKKRLYL